MDNSPPPHCVAVRTRAVTRSHHDPDVREQSVVVDVHAGVARRGEPVLDDGGWVPLVFLHDGSAASVLALLWMPQHGISGHFTGISATLVRDYKCYSFCTTLVYCTCLPHSDDD